MNPCEEEILRLTGYKPRKKYRHYQEYLICLLREVHNLPYHKFQELVSHQVYDWYKKAGRAFTLWRELPLYLKLPRRTCAILAMASGYRQKKPRLLLRSTAQT